MSKVRSFIANYSLSIILFILFFGSLVVQAYTGWIEFSGEAYAHGQIPHIFGQAGYIWPLSRAIFENWQSEFLQLFSFVVLTVYLKHKNSPQSRDGDDRRDAELQEIKSTVKDTNRIIQKLGEALSERQRTETTGFIDVVRANEFGIERRIPETTYAMTINTGEQVAKADITKVIDDAIFEARNAMEKQVVPRNEASYKEYIILDDGDENRDFSEDRVEQVKYEAMKQFLDNAKNPEDAKRIVELSGLKYEV